MNSDYQHSDLFLHKYFVHKQLRYFAENAVMLCCQRFSAKRFAQIKQVTL